MPRLLAHRPVTAWLTGVPGAGKSTLGAEAARMLIGRGFAAACLDGDVLREGLNAGLGFDPSDRGEAVRRAGEAALLIASVGAIPVVALVSPYAAHRDLVRARHRAAGVEFLEVSVEAPLAVLEARDPKGLYARARAGQLRGLTGVDDPYEAPSAPELRLRTDVEDACACASRLVDAICAAAGGEK